MKKVLCMLLIMMLCAGCACAEGYVSVADLRQQVEVTGWDKCEVILPAVDAVPVFTLQADALAQDNPLVLTVGTFDEAQSGKFVNSVRYGKSPSHTALVNGLALEEAQVILNDELIRLVGKSMDDYGLIWTEIAEWKNMETWLLYYGQKFFGLTSFAHSTSLTMDVRTQDYHHLIIPHYEAKEIVYEDVPLAAWSVIEEAVEKYLSSHKRGTPETLELGYLMQENGEDSLLVPVWHLGLTMPGGFEEVYFSAQTGEEVPWRGNKYILPEPFGWDTAK